MITTKGQDVLSSWLCKKIGLTWSSDLRCIGEVGPYAHIRGVIGYNNYNRASVQMHVAGEPGWVSRSVLYAAFHYPFVALKCNVVLGLVPSGNEDALRFNRHLGFVTLNILPNAHPDGALVIMAMYKEQCRWLNMRRLSKELHGV